MYEINTKRKLTERGIPRHGYPITDAEGRHIGIVTSGTMVPGTKTGIGMGYVAVDYAKAETEIRIDIRGKRIPAVIKK